MPTVPLGSRPSTHPALWRGRRELARVLFHLDTNPAGDVAAVGADLCARAWQRGVAPGPAATAAVAWTAARIAGRGWTWADVCTAVQPGLPVEAARREARRLVRWLEDPEAVWPDWMDARVPQRPALDTCAQQVAQRLCRDFAVEPLLHPAVFQAIQAYYHAWPRTRNATDVVAAAAVYKVSRFAQLQYAMPGPPLAALAAAVRMGYTTVRDTARKMGRVTL